MLEADFIIFGSPVYAHSITGEMKVFIDRMSRLLHLMKFTGKYGISISTSSSNGNIFVDAYLLKIMESLGIKVIDQISYIDVKKFDEESFSNSIDKIADVLNGKVSVMSSDLQQAFFNTYKSVYLKSYQETSMYEDKYKNQEALYWYKNGYLNHNSFEELFNYMKKIQ